MMTGTTTAINNSKIEPYDIKNNNNSKNYDSYIDNNDIASRIIFFHIDI